MAATWVAVAGGGYGFYTSIVEGREAREAAEQKQVERWNEEDKAAAKEISGTKAQTLKMFEIFNSSELLQARDKIYDYLDMTETAQSRLKLNDVMIYFDFFDALSLCIIEGLCDQPTAVKLFRDYAVEAWDGLEIEIVEMRSPAGGRIFVDKQFGEGVEWLMAQGLEGPDVTPDGTQPDGVQSGEETPSGGPAPAEPVPTLASDAVPTQPEQ